MKTTPSTVNSHCLLLCAHKFTLMYREDLHDFAFSFKGWESNFSPCVGSAQEIQDSKDTSFRLSHADAELGPRLLSSAWTKSELITQQVRLDKLPALPGLGYMAHRPEWNAPRCLLGPKILRFKLLWRSLCCSMGIANVFGITYFCSCHLCFRESLSKKMKGISRAA